MKKPMAKTDKAKTGKSKRKGKAGKKMQKAEVEKK